MNTHFWKIAGLALVLTACQSTSTHSSKAESNARSTPAKSQTSSHSDQSADLDKLYAAYLSNRQIYFDYESDVLKKEYKNLIAVHAKYLLSHPQTKILLQGHSDERGTPEYNLALGERRAHAVKNAFNVHGVKNTQLDTVSYGNEQASRDCADEECHKKDRRVDITYAIR